MHNPDEAFFNILTDHGAIIAVNVDEAAFKSTPSIDVHGHHAYPGMVDGHLHLIGYGQKLSRLDLTGITICKEIIKRLKGITNARIIVAEGYRECGITKDDLDAISSEKPIVLIHGDYHTITANSWALEKANITSTNGVITEREADTLKEKLFFYNKCILMEYFHRAVSHLHELGITGGHSDDLAYFNRFSYPLSAITESLQQLPFRTHLLINHRVFKDFLESKSDFSPSSPYLEFGAVKTFYDGTLSSNTAFISHNYARANHRGAPIVSRDDFQRFLTLVRQQHYPVAIHVIGDQGLDEVADWLTLFPPQQGQRDRIIHASLAKIATLEKLARLPVVIDIQPLFVTSDMPRLQEWLHIMPDLVYPWKTYLEYNLKLIGSSDAPVEDPNPLLSIHALVTRTSLKEGKTYNIEQCVDRFHAVRMYTTNHAIISNSTKSRGHIDVGYLADFSVFPADILKVEDAQLLHLKTSMTIIDEKIVYHHKER